MDLSKIKSIFGVAVLGLAGLLYLNYSGPKKVEKPSVEQAKPMYFESGLVKKCIEEMENAGAKLRYDEHHATWQFHNLLAYTDANKDNRIDKDESVELCAYWLNPETPGGRIALPYNGPSIEDNVEDGINRLSEGINKFPMETRIFFKKNLFYVISMIDENEDGIPSDSEVSRALYKMGGGPDGSK